MLCQIILLSYNSLSLFFTEALLFSFLSTRLTINSLLVAKSDKMAKNKAFYYLFIYYLLNKDDAYLRRWHLATYLPFSDQFHICSLFISLKKWMLTLSGKVIPWLQEFDSATIFQFDSATNANNTCRRHATDIIIFVSLGIDIFSQI